MHSSLRALTTLDLSSVVGGVKTTTEQDDTVAKIAKVAGDAGHQVAGAANQLVTRAAEHAAKRLKAAKLFGGGVPCLPCPGMEKDQIV
ncbi:MAG: hypothetical protein AB7O24_31325 [Kofleriaceae bacterium]